jgi:hypothetical protein
MKQYDILLDGGGGKEDDLTKTINKGLDEAYNAGIRHCIGWIKRYWEELKLHTRNGQPYFSEPHINQLISNLEALKKPTA